MASYSIKDIESFTGIKAHTIRIWEKRYNLITPKRTCTNIRSYDDEDLKKLMNISVLNKHGMKISNLVHLDGGALGEKVMSLADNYNDPEKKIESLIVAMIDLDENRFEKIVNNTVMAIGFEETMIRLIYPFFIRVGMLWQTNTINPAQEHFVSNLLRQELLVATHNAFANHAPDAKTHLLFLPEREYHELGLLFYQYLLVKHGHKVIYLGASVPFGALQEVAEKKKIDCVLTSYTNPLNTESMQEEINRLHETFPDVPVYIGGIQAHSNPVKIPANIHIIKDVAWFRDQCLTMQADHA